MSEKIIEMVLELLNTNIENVELSDEQLDEDLSQLGMDSITFIRIIVELEEKFDIEIPDEKLLLTEMNTVSKMVDVISSELSKCEENTFDE